MADLNYFALWHILPEYDACGYDEEAAQYRAILSTLPNVDSSQLTSPDSLIKQNDNGHAPLDNPINWGAFPSICKTLAEKGAPLTIQHLLQPGHDGNSYLETAMRHWDLSTIMRGLEVSGITLRKAELLDETGQPSAILNAAMENGGGLNKIFTFENWQGVNAEELKQVIKAIPETRKPANRHSLTSILSRQQNTVNISR